ncbi:MAG: GspE/PulE family protein [Patescibacteria group bacterium]|nr:GspE/PulE family protein [Patescibacteria group bacterium]
MSVLLWRENRSKKLLYDKFIIKKMNFNELLYNKLIDDGKVLTGVLEKVKEESVRKNCSVEEILIANKIISDEELAKVKSSILNIPYINLVGKALDQEAFNFLPINVAENYKIIIFGKENNELKVGMVNPQDLKAIGPIEFLSKKHHFKVKYFIISLNSFKDVINRHKNIGVEVEEALGRAKTKFAVKEPKETKDKNGLQEIIRGAPISKIVSVIIKHAVEGRASDIHIEPGVNNTRVRYRVDGVLHTSLVLPIYLHAAIVSRIKVISNLKIDETRIPQDGRIRIQIKDNPIDFRVSTLPLTSKEKIVMRVLDSSGGALSLKDLGFNERHIKVLEKGTKMPHGMILVTGPTGSGKSTTLYSLLNILNKEGVNIVTLEDPVEYYMEGVNQSQVKPEVNFTFAAGLRSILRQDPDIIMVGEIRDNETAELAVHAALTGHIVLSTLHTNSAYGSIPRLKDMKIESFLLTSTVNIVIAQRLVRKLCQFCKKEITPQKNFKEEISSELKHIPVSYFKDVGLDIDEKKILSGDFKAYEAKGCGKCGSTGYHSRAVVAEVLIMTDELKTIINRSGTSEEVSKELKKQEMISMKQDGIIKALKGITSLEEVFKVTKE